MVNEILGCTGQQGQLSRGLICGIVEMSVELKGLHPITILVLLDNWETSAESLVQSLFDDFEPFCNRYGNLNCQLLPNRLLRTPAPANS